MKQLWAGRSKKELSKDTNDFNSSISFDSRMFEEDIKGSIAHVTMLGRQNIISLEDSKKIVDCLITILEEIKSGVLTIDPQSEDIHTFVEQVLTSRLGDVGKKLHTARSRNDQVCLDTRMYLKTKIIEIKKQIKNLLQVIIDLSSKHTETIMSGYTHLQRAQPITFAHHLLAYASMFIRDYNRLEDTYKHTNVSPLGSCAFAGTTYPIDRFLTAKLLGFEDVCFNSIDGVSDRDFVVELASNLALVMTHLSRFSEEIILWTSWEFKYIELDDAYCTGSSIMPQKKNADIAELVRGKTGRVYGNLIAILTTLKGLPLAYNKDMQEDKECIFDSIDTLLQCLPIFSEMLKTITVLKDNMLVSAQKGFINATDCADYLTKKGMSFRDAYKLSGQLVAYCIDNNKTLNTLSLQEYKNFNSLFDEDVYNAIDLKNCVEGRTSYGGPSKQAVEKQIEICKEFLKKCKD